MKEGAEEEEEATVDRLTKCDHFPIIGSARALHFLSEESYRSASKLLRTLQDDIRSANATKTTLDAWCKEVYLLTFGANSPFRKLYLLSWLLVISYKLAPRDNHRTTSVDAQTYKIAEAIS